MPFILFRKVIAICMYVCMYVSDSLGRGREYCRLIQVEMRISE